MNLDAVLLQRSAQDLVLLLQFFDLLSQHVVVDGNALHVLQTLAHLCVGATQLVDVFARLPQDAALALNQFETFWRCTG